MAQRNEIAAVYAAGIIQGVALVTFPAASAIFSRPAYFRLSSTEYGGMFVPQAIMAIASSLMGAGLTRHLGIKRIFLLGLRGYGIAAFGVGPLQSRAGMELNTIYGGTAIFALTMSALSFVVVRQAASS